MCSRKWLMVALVACGLASACSQYNTNLSIQTSSSVLTFVSPSSATAGSQGFTITANGSGFTTGALILWNGTALDTTLVSGIQLTAPVPASDLATAGTINVAVQIPGSATSGTNVNSTTTTEISDVVHFTISPVPGTPPAITSLSASTTLAPSTPYCSSQGFVLTVNGTNFTTDAAVNWNGTAQSTTFVSATQLTATIPAAQAASPGPVSVKVTNSVGTSASKTFTLSTPTTPLASPTVASLSQTSAAAGSPAVVLTVTGTSLLPCSTVQWVTPGGVTTQLPTTYVSATQLNATVPPADFLVAGTAQVNVFTLAPGGGTSAALPFMILAPVISSLSPSTTPSCSLSDLTLQVTGTNFVNGSVVEWATAPPPTVPSTLATTFVSSTQVNATVPFAYIASTVAVNIEVTNFGVLSNQEPFTSSASTIPAATLASISPSTVTAGSAPFSLSVNGTGFVPCSGVQWNGLNRPTTYVSPTQVQAAITAPDIAAVGTVPVTVSNPATGGALSNAISASILAPAISAISPTTTTNCSSSGLTLTVTGTNFAPNVVVDWNGSPRPTTFISPTELTAAITPGDTAFVGTVAITVTSGAVTSNSMNFSMTAPTTGLVVPVISLPLSPSDANVVTSPVPGAIAFTLTVNGSKLLPCSSVQWNGSPRPTLYVGTTGIQASIFQTDISAVGTDQVTVSTPAPGGGPSNTAPFAVHLPVTPAVGIAAFSRMAGSSVGSAAGALTLPLESDDGRYSVFVLASSDGVTPIPGASQNVFVRDTCAGAPSGCSPSVSLSSIGLNSSSADGDSIAPSISADGRYVAFLSSAMNLADSDTNGVTDVFVRDTCAGASTGCTPSTQRVSVATGGAQANGASTSAAVSATGRYVLFQSAATNLAPGSSSGGIFLRDTCAGADSACKPSTQQIQ
jgi:hypothetical protein